MEYTYGMMHAPFHVWQVMLAQIKQNSRVAIQTIEADGELEARYIGL